MFGFKHKKKKVVGVLDSCSFFLRKYEKNKIHNMIFLMLDSRFKSLHFVFSLKFGREQKKVIIEEYDTKSLFAMLFKCHHHLHTLDNSNRTIVDERVEEDCNLDIFKMTVSAFKLVIELINREVLMFKHFQVDVKEINCPFQWWEKHESMNFPITRFLV
jgi:hypothetical protein